ncbi:MAG: hypothetical protein WKF30_17960 [Pyrinomonadaceae bacterium]
MTKDNILFTIIGLLAGSIVGFMFANTVNQRGYEKQRTQAGRRSPGWWRRRNSRRRHFGGPSGAAIQCGRRSGAHAA